MIKPDPHHKHSGTCPPTHCTFVCLSGVLDEEGGDVLVNVGLVDKENAEKNVELKKKKPDYKAYEEDESVDDMVTGRNEVSTSFIIISEILSCHSHHLIQSHCPMSTSTVQAAHCAGQV